MTVSHAARGLQPGEVVLLTVTSESRVERVEGQVLGRQVLFFPSDEPGVWRGLFGVDLDTRPGEHTITIKATEAHGNTRSATYRLRVEPKEFPTRRLTVAEQFVTPPAAVQDRIAREARQVNAIFSSSTPERFWSGAFLRPVPGAATSSFGVRTILNNQPRSPHSGTDFRAAEGTPIAAPNAGRVVLAEDLYFSGNTVIVDHGQGLYSYFAHLSRIAVREGERLASGDLIGQVGATGRVTGPHLHWAVRLAGARVDPLSLMAVLADGE